MAQPAPSDGKDPGSRHLEQPHVCDRCHGEAVFGFGSTWLCEGCYGTIGSCCMEFDGDDMFLEDRSWWESRMAPKP